MILGVKDKRPLLSSLVFFERGRRSCRSSRTQEDTMKGRSLVPGRQGHGKVPVKEVNLSSKVEKMDGSLQ